MAQTQTFGTLARTVADFVGGPDNVTSLQNCTTRLRFVVRDSGLVDYEGLNRAPGVLQALNAGGQVQVVIGTHVEDVRKEILSVPGWSQLDGAPAAEGSDRRRPLDAVFDFLGGTFQPLLPPLAGAAMVQIVAMLLTQLNIISTASPTAGILTAAGNAVFYFLPVLVAFTASRKLGANPFTGATIAAALLHPGFTAIGATGTLAQAFGLPLFMYTYSSAMFPALLIALALAGLDRVLKRTVPRSLELIVIPSLELLILVPVAALAFGPIGVLFGNGIASGTTWLSTTFPFLFYVIIPALWILFVSLGIHWALISLLLSELATQGSSAFLGAAVGYQFAIMGVAIGVLVRAMRDRNTAMRETAAAATVAAWVGGISEPTLYGLILRHRRILIVQVISAAAAGAVLGFFNTVGTGLVAAGPTFLAIPLFQPVLGFVLALCVGIAVPLVIFQFWPYEKRAAAADPLSENSSISTTYGGFRGSIESDGPVDGIAVGSPMAGTVVPLAESADPVFAGGLVGPGVAIAPSDDRVLAPADGTIVAVPKSRHAIGLRTKEGVELLIHVGMNTVRLGGTHFTVHVTQGQEVTAGDVLLDFDRKAIEAAGYSLVSPIVITNATANQDVKVIAEGAVLAGAPLLALGVKG